MVLRTLGAMFYLCVEETPSLYYHNALPYVAADHCMNILSQRTISNPLFVVCFFLDSQCQSAGSFTCRLSSFITVRQDKEFKWYNCQKTQMITNTVLN